jgi:hypothetical protein
VCSSLDECLLDEDIGGFVGTYLFDDIQKVKENSKIMTAIFGNEENLEIGENILLANWDNWSLEDQTICECDYLFVKKKWFMIS